MKKLLSFTAIGFLLGAFILVVVPAWAQDADSRIKALEDELSRLKQSQIDLKKEATAAAAALPTFSYRPGGGARIDAADQSWGINFRYEFNMDMTWL